MFGGPKIVLVNQPTRTEYVTREVHEHRAPTDESVRLLSEMEEKAREKITQAIHVGDTAFECVVHAMQHYGDGSTELVAVFSINGKKATVKYRDQDWRSDVKTRVIGLRDAVAEEIANTILAPAFGRLGQELR